METMVFVSLLGGVGDIIIYFSTLIYNYFDQCDGSPVIDIYISFDFFIAFLFRKSSWTNITFQILPIIICLLKKLCGHIFKNSYALLSTCP